MFRVSPPATRSPPRRTSIAMIRRPTRSTPIDDPQVSDVAASTAAGRRPRGLQQWRRMGRHYDYARTPMHDARASMVHAAGSRSAFSVQTSPATQIIWPARIRPAALNVKCGQPRTTARAVAPKCLPAGRCSPDCRRRVANRESTVSEIQGPARWREGRPLPGSRLLAGRIAISARATAW